ncbi:predicted protein [Naegleria gruberi]|uniref:poly(ADP-ribose) glycohydrolase n=1 Tax=Naegleria gruberi TaxID=5762 RepID=D2V8V6_NAEGR|nr:uncharacterized protein NAEGRDRAFT_47600 [Naegleria gruberi]EFC46866.1 predicted protein [Naegleria gruberi]|eukprot:XP_002679610.1 predicted protein [Naegleria gruberi strain NEG-M]
MPLFRSLHHASEKKRDLSDLITTQQEEHEEKSEKFKANSRKYNSQFTKQKFTNSEGKYNFSSSAHVVFPFMMKNSWTEIANILKESEISSSAEFAAIVRKIQKISYQSHDKKQVESVLVQDINLLSMLLDEKSSAKWEGRPKFFTETLPFIIELVLKSESILGSYAGDLYEHECQRQSTIVLNEGLLPILEELNKSSINNESRAVKLTKLECACILANSFFCTFSRLGDVKEGTLKITSINMDTLFINPYIASSSKLLMIIHYFERLCERGIEEIKRFGYVTFIRKKVEPYQVICQIQQSTVEISNNQVIVLPEGSIEDCENAIHSDFANKYIGGGVLRGGAVQEEIRFALSPECIISRLIVEKLSNNESLLICGTEQFSSHQGYAKSLLYKGDFIDGNYEKESEHLFCFKSQIVAFDSKYYYTNEKLKQWKIDCIDREIIKAYSAFCSIRKNYGLNFYSNISTGNWGGGAFNSDHELKFIIQLIVTCHCEKPMYYYTFKNTELARKFKDFLEFCEKHNVTVQKIYNLLENMYSEYIEPNSHEETFSPHTLEYLMGKLTSK